MTEVRREVHDTTFVCDFCDSPNPIWAYPCKAISDEQATGCPQGHIHIYAYRGPWAACSTCHRLI
jgi:hypothetical protein